MSHYTIGASSEGADAFPPPLLVKCMLLEKWFHIDSDPELENQTGTFPLLVILLTARSDDQIHRLQPLPQ